MIIHDCVQGTLDWMMLRLGMPTASQFDRLITPKTHKPSGAAGNYRAQLMAEWLLGNPLEWGTSGWMERGSWLEKEARSFYELTYDCEVQQAGFITRDDGLVGCSPDGLVVGTNRGLEIKCPSAHTHMKYLLGENDPEYYGQVQGCMLIAEREEWDVLIYGPSLPPLLKTFVRDDGYIKALSPILDVFALQLEADKSRFWDKRQAGNTAEEYRPYNDEELENLNRELRDAEANDHIEQDVGLAVLSHVMMGRWRLVRAGQEFVRQAVLNGPPAIKRPPLRILPPEVQHELDVHGEAGPRR